MLRVLAPLALLSLLLWSCASDGHATTCSGQDPDFIAVLRLAAAPLPADTLVHVIYAGSASEDFMLSRPNLRHEVLFCQIADEQGVPLDPSAQESAAAAGAAGASADSGASASGAQSLYCKLWTKGFATLIVSGSSGGFISKQYELAPKDGVCTVTKEFVLDAPVVN